MKEKRSNLVLTQALLISGGLNVLFLALFYYIIIQEAPLYLSFQQAKTNAIYAKETESSSSKTLISLLSHSFETLCKDLEDKTLVEDGFRVRDYALALLVQDYHFDLHRSMLGLPDLQQKRTLKIASNTAEGFKTLTLYADLTNAHYASIIDFSNQEKWPLTAKGLFLALKKKPNDPSLAQAFTNTALSNYLPETGSDFLPLILEFDWPFFESFMQFRSSVETARQFLLRTAFEKGLKLSHRLLLIYEPAFAIKKLDDASLEMLLEIQDPSVTSFAKLLATSPRSDQLIKKALALLPKEAAPILAKSNQIPIEHPEQKIHVVQEGESLWRISRIHQIDLAALKELNGLRSDQIQPGQTLYLP